MSKKKLVKAACDKIADRLPIAENKKDEVKAGCKAVSGGLWGALFHSTTIGPEPDRSASRSKNGGGDTRYESIGVLRDSGSSSSSSGGGSNSNSIPDKVMSDVFGR